MTLFEAEMEALALRAEALRRARERATPEDRAALDEVEAQLRADVRAASARQHHPDDKPDDDAHGAR